MKKTTILLALIVFVWFSGGEVWAYSAAGTVYDPILSPILTPCPNPTGTISYSIGGATAQNPITGFADGSYTGGWPMSNNLGGNTMTVTAFNAANTKGGSTSWVASSSNVETGKDVLVYPLLTINPGLITVVQPLRIGAIGNHIAPATAMVLPGTPSLMVTGFTSTVTYDPAKINCMNVAAPPTPDSFFDVTFDISVPGVIEIHGISPGGPTWIGEAAIPLCLITWDVPTIDNPDVTYVRIDSFFDVFMGSQTGSVPNRSEILLGTEEKCSPQMMVDDAVQWQGMLESSWPGRRIRPLMMAEWEEYRMQWMDPLNEKEGIGYFDEYPGTQFLPPELTVFEGDDDYDGGLVMTWGNGNTPSGNYASAWKYDYGLDPDLTNCTIQITVTAPQNGPSGQINQVSFAIVDTNGLRRSWWWQCGAPGSGAPIIWWTPTTVTINTAVAGLAAATPLATGYLNAAGFNLTQSQSFDVDENGQWIFGQVPVPPPGQSQFVGQWNYWHNLLVTKKTTSAGANKGIYVKWSQPPDADNSNPAFINGWDEWSNYFNRPVMADDFECKDNRPITDIHWWGSFQNWTLHKPPAVMPRAFHLAIWTDVPANDPGNPLGYSHPGRLLWENRCTSYVWNFAGIDVDPQGRPEREGETCFQFTQLLDEDDWFYQKPDEVGIYWLSIAPIWDASQMQSPDFHEWGWKTRPHNFQDDAVRIQDASIWPLQIGAQFLAGSPVEFPVETSWDLTFELTTNLPAYVDHPLPGDLTGPAGIPDGVVNLADFVVIAGNWLETAP